jgi:hypothetical protein
MTALNKNNGPYSLEVNVVEHRGVKVTTMLNTLTFDNMIKNMDKVYDYEIGYIPAGYEHRPDLIANTFYNKPTNWWLLMLVNNISDPAEGFLLNQKILIPKL